MCKEEWWIDPRNYISNNWQHMQHGQILELEAHLAIQPLAMVASLALLKERDHPILMRIICRDCSSLLG